MNNNYLIYNNLGILKNSQLEEISQGNHNVDYYYIAYDSYDYTNGFVTLSCTLPDGTSLPELSTSPKDFEFNGEKYKGFLFVVRDTLTTQAGVLSMTFNLKSVENDTQLCSSRLNVTIHESDVSTEPTITQAQYDQMQEVIRENTVIANEALEKANEAYSHDATLVKINGEVQQTWDATAVAEITKSEAEFLKNEHDKSLNEININDYAYRKNNTIGLNANYGDDTWKFQGVANGEYDDFTRINVRLKANTEYSISFVKNNDAFFWFRNSNNQTIVSLGFGVQDNTKTIVLPEDVCYIDIGWEHLVVGQSYNLEMSKIMINKGDPLPYQEWNGEIIHRGDIEPVTLFSGRSNETITLTDNWYNYDRFKIEFEDNFSNQNSIEIDNSGTLVAMSVQNIDTYEPDNWAYINNIAIGEFYANQFKINKSGRWYHYANGTTNVDQNKNIYVTKILGYKEV